MAKKKGAHTNGPTPLVGSIASFYGAVRPRSLGSLIVYEALGLLPIARAMFVRPSKRPA